MKKIIYDLGASRGENLPYYLLKSELVVAVDANTENCKFINRKFLLFKTKKALRICLLEGVYN